MERGVLKDWVGIFFIENSNQIVNNDTFLGL